MKKGLVALVALVVIVPAFSLAQAPRSYHYAAIATTIDVRTDTTIDVEERQTFAFVGEYHQANREIPRKALDRISDISVLDADTGLPLTYSRSVLDKTLPSSWNKYTVHNDNGKTIIEWYYNLSDTPDPTRHTWIIRYTVHGALAFYKDHDELYWNLFTDYSVPVDSVEATIHLPGAITAPQASFYTTQANQVISQQPDAQTFYFKTGGFGPQESATFAVGWQKGLVDQSAYWWDFARTYWQYAAALLIILVSIVYSVMYWIYTERRNRGRGTIIPQYDPPEGLRPAMAEVIAKGHVTSKAWPATVIDLAVRGYIQIEEVKTSQLFGLFNSTEYMLTRLKEADSSLEEYERDFMDILFPGGDTTFSTAALKKSTSLQMAFSKKIDTLTKGLYVETQTDTQAFDIDPAGKRWFTNTRPFFLWRLFTLPILLVVVLWGMGWWMLGAAGILGLCAIGYVMFLKTRLNKHGHILKEEWLGFKMYLETAERYRMQNLTPDLFEKYLPYAIIFGVEKKWAKAFESLNLPQPNWYSGAYIAGAPGSGGSSFSPSAFSSSFSASFVSSFASAGGAGASGGGGGAGGGGGGGGGGAS